MRYYKNIGTGKNKSFDDKAPNSNWVEISKKQFDKEGGTSSTPTPTPTPVPENLNTTPLGLSGVNALFSQYYGRNATQQELDYWKNKSDAELRPKLIPNSERELAKNKPKTTTPMPTPTSTPSPAPTTGGGGTSKPAPKTSRSDVIANFVRYHGRQPNTDELKAGGLIDNLMTKAPTEVEQLLAKDSPITKGLVWGEYQEQQEEPTAQVPPNEGIQDILDDPNSSALYNQLDETLQMIVLQMSDYTNSLIEAGNTINPDITISDEMVASFRQQATEQFEPYFKEQMKNYENDLNLSSQRLEEDYQKSIARAEDPFKQRLAAQSEGEAQAGLAFGSERGVRQRQAVKSEQQALDDYWTKIARGSQDALIAGERDLGSDYFGENINVPQFTGTQVSTQGYTQTGSRNLFTPQGGLYGAIPYEQKTAVETKVEEEKEKELATRVLLT